MGWLAIGSLHAAGDSVAVVGGGGDGRLLRVINFFNICCLFIIPSLLSQEGFRRTNFYDFAPRFCL